MAGARLAVHLDSTFLGSQVVRGWVRRILLIGMRSALLLVLLFLILRPILLAEFKSALSGRRRAVDRQHAEHAIARPPAQPDADKARRHRQVGSRLLDTVAGRQDAGPRPPMSRSIRSCTELVRGRPHSTRTPQPAGRPAKIRWAPAAPPLRRRAKRGPPDETQRQEGPRRQNLLDGFKAEEVLHLLADSIVKIVQSRDSDPPVAIKSSSPTGQDNASKYTLQEAAHRWPGQGQGRQGTQGYQRCTSTASAALEGALLQWKELGAPETLGSSSMTARRPPIGTRRAQGFQAGRGRNLDLARCGKVVVEKKPKLQNWRRPAARSRSASSSPSDLEKREEQELSATIKYKVGGETYVDSLSRVVRVADSKIKVLFVENWPRWEVL